MQPRQRPLNQNAAPGAELIAPRDYEQFRERVLALTRIDLNQYKNQQLLRRLTTQYQRYGFHSLSEYGQLLATDPTELRQFRDWFTINVSEFFRDPVRWNDLRVGIIPRLLAHRRRLRIWSAGCSHGAESFSLAISLADLPTAGAHYILATDIDPAALAQARAGGPYQANDLRNVSPSQRLRFFRQKEEEHSGQWVSPEIRGLVTFRRHDLLRDAVETDFDLVVCRNVLIYFTDEAKATVFERFHRALRPGGILFVGGTELLSRPGDFGFALERTSFYRRQ